MLEDLERGRRAAFIQRESREPLALRVGKVLSAAQGRRAGMLPACLRLVRARHADGLDYLDVRLVRGGA